MTRPYFRGALIASLFFAPALAAQAPRITSDGDPSVRNDTIYALAADPSRYPEEDYIVLLDDGVVRVEADGRTTRTYRQVIQLLTADAVQHFSERVYGWATETEKFHLNWIRVVGLDGKVISPAPTQQQESDVPIPVDDPVYAKRKELRVSLSGVAKGTIVDWSYTIERTKVWIPGDFSTSWSIQSGVPVRRSRLILDYPTAMHPHLVETNLSFAPQRVTRAGRTTVTYATQEVEHLKPQRFATDTGPRWMSIAATGPVTWEGIGKWYQGLAAARTILGPVATKALAEKLVGARTLMDSVRAVHKWVSQDIRYVSIDLGAGGYQPRTPDEVVTTGYGDCKDKATLFVAAMRAFGLRAKTLLLGSSGSSDPRLPAIEAFDHAIARVELPSGAVFTDLTAGMIPFGELPGQLEEQLGVLVGVTGEADTVRIPVSKIEANHTQTMIRGVIDTTGRIRGEFIIERAGITSYEMRDHYSVRFDSTDRDKLGRNVVQSMFPGAVCDSLTLFDGKDLAAPVRIWFSYHDGRILRRSGRNWILPNPLGSMEELDASADAIEREGERWAPIDIAAANGITLSENEFELTLPPGWKPALPPAVHVKNVVGGYDVDYTFDNGVIRGHRVMLGARGALPPSRIKEVIDFFREIASDNTPLITLETGTH